ncbi:zinc knuckle protein (macronuclear) [Tetrahymena thermophila SB210]|uniref:Zinc knuckle protein n=1 Tax=Tetrahymena thermophila (strain SB210) TaxID=312017 RepID=Q23E87_TETTS|nr:zinc knuckle protein [Tetrahymena thermophila SB210]EAR94866.2 zinc knuckle protein [Tetrahymena thermophila SB210]|eukprot:XP_001015111.2 zinc knuckle protein [Tetrahymena thermophila SB210]
MINQQDLQSSYLKTENDSSLLIGAKYRSSNINLVHMDQKDPQNTTECNDSLQSMQNLESSLQNNNQQALQSLTNKQDLQIKIHEPSQKQEVTSESSSDSSSSSQSSSSSSESENKQQRNQQNQKNILSINPPHSLLSPSNSKRHSSYLSKEFQHQIENNSILLKQSIKQIKQNILSNCLFKDKIYYKPNFLKRLVFILKFYRKMKQNVLKKSLKYLSEKFFYLINDKASQVNSKKKQKNKYLRKFENLLKIFQKFSIDTFRPENTFTIVVKLLQLAVIICQCWWLPIQMLFEDQIYELEVSTICVFSAALRSYNCNIPTMLSRITFIYFIFTYCFQNSNYQIKQQQPFFYLTFKTFPSFRLAKMLGILLLSAHFFACGFIWIGSNTDQNNNWIAKQSLQGQSWGNIYINSLYFSIVTMITVGYGDITPVNLIEKTFVMIIMVFNCGLFGYYINVMSEIFRIKEQENMVVINQQLEIFKYLKLRGVSNHIQTQVAKQLEYINYQESSQKGEHLISKLGEGLRNEVKKDIYLKYIQNHVIMKRIFSQQFLFKLSLHMKEMILYPNQILHKRGEQIQRIYMIFKGVIEYVFEGDTDQQISSFQSGQIISIERFIAQQNYEATLKSQNMCTLIYIDFNDFKNLLCQFQQDFEKYFMIKDLIQQKLTNPFFSYEQCQSCQQFNHTLSQCPSVTFQPQRDIVVNRHAFSMDQKRQKVHKQRFKSKICCLSELHKIRVMFKKYRLDNLDDDQKKNLSSFQDQKWTEHILLWTDKVFMQRLPIKIKVRWNDDEQDQQVRESRYDVCDYIDYEDEEEEEEEDEDDLGDSEYYEQSQKENNSYYDLQSIGCKDDDLKSTQISIKKQRLNSIKLRESQQISQTTIEELFKQSSNKKISLEHQNEDRQKRDSQKTIQKNSYKMRDTISEKNLSRRQSCDKSNQQQQDGKHNSNLNITEQKSDLENKSQHQIQPQSQMINDQQNQIMSILNYISTFQKGVLDIMNKQSQSMSNLSISRRKKKKKRNFNRLNSTIVNNQDFEISLTNFERCKEYKLYFPEYNLSVIMEQIKKKHNYFMKKWIEGIQKSNFTQRRSLFKKIY